MIGKIIDGVLVEPSENERQKIVVTNPTDEMLKMFMGYKDVFIEDEPDYDGRTHFLKPIYEETDNGINVSWSACEFPTEC